MLHDTAPRRSTFYQDYLTILYAINAIKIGASFQKDPVSDGIYAVILSLR
jgi:hypothetical protein